MSTSTEDSPAAPGPSRAAGRAVLVAVGIAAAFVAGIVGRELVTGRGPDTDVQGLFWPNPKAVEAFSLTDHNGETFDVARFRDKWSLLFFGYTHCPDVCPVTMSVINQVYDLYEERGVPVDDLQTVFVSVDPKRDTLEDLGAYVTYFDPRFLAVTGPEEKLQGLTRQLGVLYIFNDPDEHGSYLVDHTASVLLVGPQGRLVGLFGAPHDPVDMADRLVKMREVVEG